MRNTVQWISILGLALGAFACEEKASTEAQPAEKPAEVVKPAPKAEVAPASIKQEAAPAADNSWQLTDARRAAIEGSVADSKGFLDAQQQLSEAKPADSAAALKSLDASKGKWLLLVGSVSKVSDTGLEITLGSSDSAAPAAAPAGAKEPTAASAPSVAINVTKIDAFKKDAYQVDQKVAVLAKYSGAGKAEPAYDVVAMGKWQEAAAGAAQPAAAQPAAGNPSPAAQGAAAPSPATKPESKY